MLSTTRLTRRRRHAATGVLGAIAALAMATASAAPVPTTSPVTGTIDLNGNESTLDGVVFDGTVDDETGDLVGRLVFPERTIDVTDPAPASITVVITQPADGTGGIDPGTQAADFAAEIVVTLTTVSIGGGPPAPLTPCSFLATLSLTGELNLDDNTLSLAQDGFPVIVNPADTAPRCGGLAALIDPRLVGTNNAVDALIDLDVTDAEAPTPPAPTPPAPTPAPTAPPATAAQTAPRFTG